MINVQIIDNSDLIKTKLFGATVNIFLDSDEIRALNSVEQNQWSIVLLNYSVRNEETVDYIRLILSLSPASKVIVIADNLSEKQILNCLIAGAQGYQDVKQLEQYKQKLFKAIEAGESWITRRMLALLLNHLLDQ